MQKCDHHDIIIPSCHTHPPHLKVRVISEPCHLRAHQLVSPSHHRLDQLFEVVWGKPTADTAETTSILWWLLRLLLGQLLRLGRIVLTYQDLQSTQQCQGCVGLEQGWKTQHRAGV
jgi:hypothetical protein